MSIWENVKSGKLNIGGDIALPDSKVLEKANSCKIPSPLEVKPESPVIEYTEEKKRKDIFKVKQKIWAGLEQVGEKSGMKGYKLPGMDNPEDPFPTNYETLYHDESPSESASETEKPAPKPSEIEGDSVKDSSNKKKDDYEDGNGFSSKKQKFSFTIKKG